jgi:hypothetical protein
LSLSDFASLNSFASFFLVRTQNGCKFMNREIYEIREKTRFRVFRVFRGLSGPLLGAGSP